MPFTTSCRVSLAAAASMFAVAACGSSAPASPTPSRGTNPPATSSAAATSSPGSVSNPATKVALVLSDLPSSLASFVQASDGLLGTTPNTDSRVFASSDNTTRVEIDIAADTASAALTDYGAYRSAAAKQITTTTTTTTPSIGQQANEYVGTDVNGHNAVSLSFLEGSDIVVVTMVSSTATVDATVVEAIATTQDSKITSGA